MVKLAEHEPAAVTASADAERQSSRTALPLALTTLRVCLAPVVIVLAIFHLRGAWMTACIVAALLSDYFDGVLARRLGVATAGLRRFDSIADTVFYAGVLYALWRLERHALLSYAVLLGSLLALEVIRAIFERIKFRQFAAYHMWSAKLWGLVLAVATIALLGYGYSGVLLPAALILGIVSDLEGLSISLLLKEARHDVPTVFHALRSR